MQKQISQVPLDAKAQRLKEINDRIDRKFGKEHQPWGWGKRLLVASIITGVVGSGIYYLKNQKETLAPVPQKTEQVVPTPDTTKQMKEKQKKIKKKVVQSPKPTKVE